MNNAETNDFSLDTDKYESSFFTTSASNNQFKNFPYYSEPTTSLGYYNHSSSSNVIASNSQKINNMVPFSLLTTNAYKQDPDFSNLQYHVNKYNLYYIF